MRFLADEIVSRLVIEQLRAAGFDITAIGATSSGYHTPTCSRLRIARVVF
jgi:hypothetical protein